jgi:hypothetical protein
VRVERSDPLKLCPVRHEVHRVSETPSGGSGVSGSHEHYPRLPF